MSEILKPKQKRSELTQIKILQSLNTCLETQFFEHISIAQIAKGADVSVGTFYRRFKDKNALLPLLYKDLGIKLSTWVDDLVCNEFEYERQALSCLIDHMYTFIKRHAGIFRTIHLNSRLYPELIAGKDLEERNEEFSRIADWMLAHSVEKAKQDKERLQMTLFIIISAMIEKVLYKQLTPAIATPSEDEAFCRKLTDFLNTTLKER